MTGGAASFCSSFVGFDITGGGASFYSSLTYSVTVTELSLNLSIFSAIDSLF